MVSCPAFFCPSLLPLDSGISVFLDCVFNLPSGPGLRGLGLNAFYPSVPQSEMGMIASSLAMEVTGD